MRIVKWRSSAAYWMNPPPFKTRVCVSNGSAHVSPSQRCKWPDRSRVRFLFKFALEVRTQVRTSPHQHPLAWTLQAYWSVLARTWVATSNQMQNVFDFKCNFAFELYILWELLVHCYPESTRPLVKVSALIPSAFVLLSTSTPSFHPAGHALKWESCRLTSFWISFIAESAFYKTREW